MANYGLNFGFRRTGGDAATREGRYRVPTTGTFRQGDFVTIDDANPGYVKKLASGGGVTPGLSGLLIQHEGPWASVFEAPEVDSHDAGKVRNGMLATIWSGDGIKFWVANTEAQNRWDGRSIDAVTVATLTGLAVGDELEWDGSKLVKKVSGTAVARVLGIDDDETRAELLLLTA